MDSAATIVDVLASAFSCWQEKREQDELMGYMNKYLQVPHCQNFIVNHVRNLKNGNTEELQQMYQELLQYGEVELADKIKTLASGKAGMSEELYTALELYMTSEDFNKRLESNLVNYSSSI